MASLTLGGWGWEKLEKEGYPVRLELTTGSVEMSKHEKGAGEPLCCLFIYFILLVSLTFGRRVHTRRL